MLVEYTNGSYDRAKNERFDSYDYEQVKDAIFVAESKGMPFYGEPDEMARDAVIHIGKDLRPLILDCWMVFDSRKK